MIKILKAINPFSNKDTDNKILYIIKILLTTQILYFVSLIITETIIIGISYLFGYNATDNQIPSDIILIISFFGYIVPILTFILYTKKINKSSIEKIGLNKNIKPFFKGILIGLVTISLIIILLILFKAINFNGINKNINWLSIILFLFAYLIQSSMEEVICRGFIFHRLKEKITLLLAVIINVGFFMIGHVDKMFESGILIGIIGIVNAVLIGLIFTILTIKDKNIYSAIGFHCIWNFTLYSIIGLNLSGNNVTNSIFNISPANTFLTGSSYGIESSIICTIVYMIVLFILLITKNTNKYKI